MASYAKDNSVRIDRSYNNDMWEGFVKRTGGHDSEAAYILNSKEGWAKDIVEDYTQEYIQKMEHKILPQADTRVATEGGFHNATSHMAKQHDTSTQSLRQVDRQAHDAKTHDMKAKSGLAPEQLSQQKETLAGEIKQGSNQVHNRLDQQKSMLSNQEKTMQKDFKESNEENLAWKGTKAFGKLNEFNNNPSFKQSKKTD